MIRLTRCIFSKAGRSYRFDHAIVRRPCPSVISGLRSVDTGAPDFNLMEEHHAAYISTLRDAGAKVVIELDPLLDFPDSVFVEDTALCLQEGAVILRPGAPSRLQEAELIAPTLQALYPEGSVKYIEGVSSFIEGGDILTTEDAVLVGRSARTNAAGIEELSSILKHQFSRQYTVREVLTPKGILHFKTDCSLLDEHTILCTPRLRASGCFDVGYNVILTAPGEEACANAIRFNDVVLFPAGFPRTRDALVSAGYRVQEMEGTEFAKVDGGMSCLSLRFSPNPVPCYDRRARYNV
jgi:dimethylargininase